MLNPQKARQGKWRVGLLSAATLGMLAMMTPSAFAVDDIETNLSEQVGKDQLGYCASGYKGCKFIVTDNGDPDLWYGPFKKVSGDAVNCSGSESETRQSWSDSTTVEMGISLATGAKLFEILNAETQVTYSRSAEHTVSGENVLKTPAGHVGWIERNQLMRTRNGYYRTMTYDMWGMPVPDSQEYRIHVAVADPVPDGTKGAYSQVKFVSRAMTDEEKASYCPT
jgi:hypothetical protein